jgi:hypothetical protein
MSAQRPYCFGIGGGGGGGSGGGLLGGGAFFFSGTRGGSIMESPLSSISLQASEPREAEQ